MKEIVILSGKGGTGKTSVTASFAALAGGAVLADYDVDAADLHLVVNPTPRLKEDFICGQSARINPEACLGCGQCKDVCRFDAVVEKPDGPVRYGIDALACEGCGVCKLGCGAGAITLEPRRAGQWFADETRFGPLVHAQLGPAAQNSGKLVTHLREFARYLAEDAGLPLVLADGSPGIGCPVISSLTGASFVVFVSEPTVSGLHDLKRVMSLARHFKIPGALAVNKADINEALSLELEKAASESGFALLGRIPYSAEVSEAQIAQTTVVEYSKGPASVALEQMWGTLRGLLTQVKDMGGSAAQ